MTWHNKTKVESLESKFQFAKQFTWINYLKDLLLTIDIHDCELIGVVIRDWLGHSTAAKCQGRMEAHTAEIQVVRLGLEFVRDRGLRSIILEGDASNVFGRLDADELDLSYNDSVCF